ncbi:MAG: hypothetical protein KF855_17130 [Acidobacteria bacterium]|nr:hypothetical protein [Acidobacteriota bacterium]
MKIVASVQSKRGSSRGLVHYIAHSKLDLEREPQNSREIFNAFSDNLSAKSANNSMIVGVAKSVPSNDELHHLVLSFRNEDYRKLGADEIQQQKALKDITRAAMRSLETAANAERLLWAAAVHRNTENPHVHIAIQKQYLSKEIKRNILTKIPREALPHSEIRDGEKVIVPGVLIEAATEKMEAIIDRERTRNRVRDRSGRDAISNEHSGRGAETVQVKKSEPHMAADRHALAKGILAESELLQIDKRIDSLLDHGDEMRFTVNDPVSGKRKRLSLREIQIQKAPNKTDQPTPAELQIKTILHKMLLKEEAAKAQLENDVSDVIREAKQIRGDYRKSGRQLPVPSLTKDELDKLQEQCLEASDIRRFSYLERTRTQLVRSGEIEARSRGDVRSILAQKNISELQCLSHRKMYQEQIERGYYLRFNVGEKYASLADLDREQKEPENPVFSFLRKVKRAAVRFTNKGIASTRADETGNIRNEIVEKLEEQLASIKKTGKVEQNKAKILEKVLNAASDKLQDAPAYSPKQIAEIEKLSVRLKLKDEYERNWKDQCSMIESAESDCTASQKILKADPTVNFAGYKQQIIAGRALAREIVATVEFDRAKEDLKVFQESKRFQKFAVADKNSGSVSYLSVHDVDLPRRGSLLDRALEELLEGREHKALRRTVSALVNDKEQMLKEDVTAAKEIMISASRNASEFREFSYLGLKGETSCQPIFTSAEIGMLESRYSKTGDPKEAERLQTVLDSAADRSVHSVSDMLRDFEAPKHAPSEVKEIVIPLHGRSKDKQEERETGLVSVPRHTDRSTEGHSR